MRIKRLIVCALLGGVLTLAGCATTYPSSEDSRPTFAQVYTPSGKLVKEGQLKNKVKYGDTYIQLTFTDGMTYWTDAKNTIQWQEGN